MTAVTVNTGKEIVVNNGNGGSTTYVGGQTVQIPAADAVRFIAAGLCVAA